MPTTSRTRLAASTLDGAIFVIGGYSQELGWLDLVQRYNVITRRWTPVTPMPTKRGELAAATAGDLIYAFGGRDTPYPRVGPGRRVHRFGERLEYGLGDVVTITTG